MYNKIVKDIKAKHVVFSVFIIIAIIFVVSYFIILQLNPLKLVSCISTRGKYEKIATLAPTIEYQCIRIFDDGGKNV